MGIKNFFPLVFGIVIPPFAALIILPRYPEAHNKSVLGAMITTSPTPPLSASPTNTPTAPPTSTSTPLPTPRPTKTPTPSPIPVTSAQLDEWFTAYSNHYSIEREKLWRMAVCESNLKVNAKNGDYIGLYQFSTSTWKSTRRAMNADPNPNLRLNPEESIRTAAFKISTAGLSAWPNCNNH